MKENLLENNYEQVDWDMFLERMTRYLEETRFHDETYKQEHTTLFELASSIRPDFKERAYKDAMKYWYFMDTLTQEEKVIFLRRLETDKILQKEVEEFQNSIDFDRAGDLTLDEVDRLGKWMEENPDLVENISNEREFINEISSPGPVNDLFRELEKKKDEDLLFLKSKAIMEVVELIFTNALTSSQAREFVSNYLVRTDWDAYSKSFTDYYKYQFGVDLPPMTGKEIMKFIYKYMFDTYGVF